MKEQLLTVTQVRDFSNKELENALRETGERLSLPASHFSFSERNIQQKNHFLMSLEEKRRKKLPK